MTSLAQLGVIYVYILLVILIVSLGYVGFRVVNWAIARFAGENSEESGTKKPAAAKTNIDTAWVRLAFLSATILFLAIFTSGVFKVIGVGESHDHQTHAQANSQPTVDSQASTSMPSNYQSQNQNLLNPNQLDQNQINQYQLNPNQVNQYQLQSQLNVMSFQLAQIEAALNGY